MISWLKQRRNLSKVGRWSGWIALALLGATALSGYGITASRLIEPVTFGLLGKAASLRLHHYMDVPLAVFTLLHVGIGLWGRWSARRRKSLLQLGGTASRAQGEE